MKTSRFNEGQIIKAIKEHEGGRKAEDIMRDLGISQVTFYQWKQKYGGMEASDVRRLKDLKLDNSRLKRLVADTIRAILGRRSNSYLNPIAGDPSRLESK